MATQKLESFMPLLRLLLFFCCLSNIADLCAQSAEEKYAIRQFAHEFMAAYNRQDVAALRAMYTTHNADDTIAGTYYNFIAKSFEDNFIVNDITLLVHQLDVIWSDAEHTLIAIGTYERYGTTSVYNNPHHQKNAYRNAMVKEDGKWKIAKSVVTPVVKTFVQQKTSNHADWKSTMTIALLGSSVLTMEIGTAKDEPNTAYALLEWPSLAVAEAFFANPKWLTGFRAQIEAPKVYFLKDL